MYFRVNCLLFLVRVGEHWVLSQQSLGERQTHADWFPPMNLLWVFLTCGRSLEKTHIGSPDLVSGLLFRWFSPAGAGGGAFIYSQVGY